MLILPPCKRSICFIGSLAGIFFLLSCNSGSEGEGGSNFPACPDNALFLEVDGETHDFSKPLNFGKVLLDSSQKKQLKFTLGTFSGKIDAVFFDEDTVDSKVLSFNKDGVDVEASEIASGERFEPLNFDILYEPFESTSLSGILSVLLMSDFKEQCKVDLALKGEGRSSNRSGLTGLAMKTASCEPNFLQLKNEPYGSVILDPTLGICELREGLVNGKEGSHLIFSVFESGVGLYSVSNGLQISGIEVDGMFLESSDGYYGVPFETVALLLLLDDGSMVELSFESAGETDELSYLGKVTEATYFYSNN